MSVNIQEGDKQDIGPKSPIHVQLIWDVATVVTGHYIQENKELTSRLMLTRPLSPLFLCHLFNKVAKKQTQIQVHKIKYEQVWIMKLSYKTSCVLSGKDESTSAHGNKNTVPYLFTSSKQRSEWDRGKPIGACFQGCRT